MTNEGQNRDDKPPFGVEPDDAVAPLTCPACGQSVPKSCGGRCSACGREFDRYERLVEEHGPEAFIPNALPMHNDLTGPIMIVEAGLVVSLGLMLLILVYRIFGGWTWSAALFALCYWTCYGLIRRRYARRTLRAIVDALRLDYDEDDAENTATQ
jgi:type IV secretory pathway TrbD component